MNKYGQLYHTHVQIDGEEGARVLLHPLHQLVNELTMLMIHAMQPHARSDPR